MKKRNTIVLTLVIVLVILGSSIAMAIETGYFEGFKIINVTVNGKKVEGDVPAVLLNDRTMVPVRFVSEALGAEVDWDQQTYTAVITTTTTNSDYYNSVAKHEVDNLHRLNKLSLANHLLRLNHQTIQSVDRPLHGIESYRMHITISNGIFRDNTIDEFMNQLYVRMDEMVSTYTDAYDYWHDVSANFNDFDLIDSSYVDIALELFRLAILDYIEAANLYNQFLDTGDVNILVNSTMRRIDGEEKMTSASHIVFQAEQDVISASVSSISKMYGE